MFRGSSLNLAQLVTQLFTTQAYGSQIVTTSTVLTQTSPYRTIVNSASGTTITLPSPATANDTRVVTNVGAGTVSVSYTGRIGATTKSIAQDNANTFAWNATLGYWTLE